MLTINCLAAAHGAADAEAANPRGPDHRRLQIGVRDLIREGLQVAERRQCYIAASKIAALSGFTRRDPTYNEVSDLILKQRGCVVIRNVAGSGRATTLTLEPIVPLLPSPRLGQHCPAFQPFESFGILYCQ
jgi:hypothetical protein